MQEFGKFLKKVFGDKFDISAVNFSFLNKSLSIPFIIILSLLLLLVIYFLRNRIINIFKRKKTSAKQDFLNEFKYNVSIRNFSAALRLLIQHIAEYTGKTASTFTELFHLEKDSANSDLADHYGRVIHLHSEADESVVRRTYHQTSGLVPELKKKKFFDTL